MKILVQTKHNIIFEALANFFQDWGYLCHRLESVLSCEGFLCCICDEELSSLEGESLGIPIFLLANDSRNFSESFEIFNKPLQLTRLLKACEEAKEKLRSSSFFLGPYEIFFKGRQAVHITTQQVIFLTEKEAEILKLLYTNGSELTRDEILHCVWGYGSDVDTHTLETHIYKLRKKLLPENPEEFIVTNAKGYSLRI